MWQVTFITIAYALWTHIFIASVPFLSSNVFIPSVASLFHGLGGAAMVGQALQWGYIADTAAPKRRSIYLSLALFANLVGVAIGFVVSSRIITSEKLPVAFMLGFWAWTIHALLAAGLLPDDHIPSSAHTDTAFTCLASVVEPIVLILEDQTLKSLAFAYVLLWLGGMGVFSPLFSVAVSRFGHESINVSFAY